jgi:hypothetical protein
MFEKLKAWPRKAKYSTDVFMTDKLKFSNRQRHLTWHALQLLRDQVLAVIPISLLQIFVLGVFFQQTIVDAGLQVMGLILAIIGLALFLDGLRISIMPLAEVLGKELPKKLHVAFVLLIAGFIGILVTYAEPAVASLRPLGSLVDPNDAPYLYFIMNDQQELMVFAIGAGVGVAAIIGTLRFMQGWSLKPIMFASLAPTVGMACYMQWGNTDLQPCIALAWDVGAVTTGPVTVPVLLALGIGVMHSTRQKRLARAALEGAVNTGSGNALEGFGIVTLASLWPILAVELMAIIDGAIYDREYVLEKAATAAAQPPSSSAIDTSPLKEVVYAIRSIMPLVIVLIFLVLVVIRTSLPECTWWVDPPAEEDISVRDGSVRSGDIAESKPGNMPTALDRASMAIAKGLVRENSEVSLGSMESGSEHGGTAALHAITESKRGQSEEEAKAKASEEENEDKVGCWTRFGRGLRSQAPLIVGICCAQIGMILFNLGLTYSFTKLGDQTGITLPAAFAKVPQFEKSPYYSYAGGLILDFVVIFILGVLATRAEPALNVLGRTVERLSGGTFTAKMLIGSVCIGVGCGLIAGTAKIIYSIPIIYFILGKYAIAVGLTLVTAEALTAIAWDSAGVTTGPVTVPFVLSIGIGFSTSLGSSDGFGLLTIASVAPIIAVLTTSLLRKPAKTARKQLSLGARSLGRSVTNMRAMRSMRRSPSLAIAAFASNAGGSTAPTPDSSIRGGADYAAGDNAA